MSRRAPLILGVVVAVGTLGFLARDLFDSAPAPQGAGIAVPGDRASGNAEAAVPGGPGAPHGETDGGPEGGQGPRNPTDPSDSRESLADARLTDARWVEGRVLLPGALPADESIEIEATGRRFESGPFHRVPVDASGAFRVAFSPRTRRGRFQLHGRYVYLDGPARIDLEDPETPLEILAHLGGRIEGRLLPPESKPEAFELGGLTLELEGTRTTGRSESRRSWNRSTTTDPTGAFAFASLPPDGTFTLQCDPEGAAPVKLEGLRVVAGEVESVELPLIRGVTLAGHVLDPRGQGIPNAEVRVERIQRFGWSTPVRTITDAAGSFSIAGLTPGSHRVEAEVPGLLPAIQELEDLPDGSVREDLVLVLEPGLGVSGRVVWPDGTPASGAELVLEFRGPDEHSFGEQSSRTLEPTDGEGRFEITGLPEGLVRLRASATPAPGRLGPMHAQGIAIDVLEGEAFEARTQLGAVPRSNLELRLAPGHALEGRVEDTAGQVIPNARVSVVRLGPSDSDPSGADTTDADPWVSADAEMIDEVEHETPVNPKDGSFRLGGLRSGRWGVTVEAMGCAPLGPVALEIPRTEAWVAILPRTASVRGRVLDASGSGLEGAGVRAISANPNADWDEGTASGIERSDRDGHFELQGIESGVVRITAWAHGHAPGDSLALDLRPGDQRDDLEIRLGPAGRIDGRILDAEDRAAPGWRVSLRSFLSNRPLSTTSDRDGAFLFDDLAAGVYFLEGVPPSSVLDEVLEGRDSWEREEYYALTAQARIELGPGEHRTLEVGGTPGDTVTLHGTASRGGVGVPGVELRLGPVGDARGTIAFASTDAEGKYEVELIQGGPWKIHVQVDGVAWEEALDVPRVESLRHDFVLPTGSVRGRVVDAEGKGIARMGVQVVRTDDSTGGPGGGWTEADAEGNFEVASLPAGKFEVRAGGGFFWEPELSKFSPASMPFALDTGESLEGLELTLEEGGVLIVDVFDSEGRPSSAATILVRNAEGDIVLWDSPFGQQVHDARRTLRGLPMGALSLTASSEFEVTPSPTRVNLEGLEPTKLELRLRRGTMLVLNLHGFDPKQPPMVGEAIDALGQHFQPTILAVGWSPEIAMAAPVQRIGPVPPGTYTVRAESPAGEVSEERTVEVSGETEIQVPLGPR